MSTLVMLGSPLASVSPRRVDGEESAGTPGHVPAAAQQLDALVGAVVEEASPLPRVMACNAAEESRRLLACLHRGQVARPAWRYAMQPPTAAVWQRLRLAEQLAADLRAGGWPWAEAYLARLHELEAELQVVAALGKPKQLRQCTAAAFGTGEEPCLPGDVPLVQHARRMLHGLPKAEDDAPAAAAWHTCAHGPTAAKTPAGTPAGTLAACLQHLAAQAGLPLRMRCEPRLSAWAATGGDLVWLRCGQAIAPGVALRVAVHELFGHLLAHANAAAQPVGLLRFGTAGSLAQQEGAAICHEARAGLLGAERLRILAARAVAVAALHEGATFDEAARLLMHDHGCSAEAALAAAERAYRGGGLARDGIYLRGYLQVQHAIERGEARLDELSWGKVGLADLPLLRRAMAAAALPPPAYRPNFPGNLAATLGGTSRVTSPPSAKASFTRFELT